jgi:hypothetical protein
VQHGAIGIKRWSHSRYNVDISQRPADTPTSISISNRECDQRLDIESIYIITGRTVGCVLFCFACRSFYLFILLLLFSLFVDRFSRKRLGLQTPNLVGMFLRTICNDDHNFKGVASRVCGQTPKMCMHWISRKTKVN